MALMSFCISTVAICDRMRLIVITTAKTPKITVMIMDTTNIAGSMSVRNESIPANGLVVPAVPSLTSSRSTSGFVMI